MFRYLLLLLIWPVASHAEQGRFVCPRAEWVRNGVCEVPPGTALIATEGDPAVCKTLECGRFPSYVSPIYIYPPPETRK